MIDFLISTMLLAVAGRAEPQPATPVVIYDPGPPTNIVRTIEGRCGDKRYQVIYAPRHSDAVVEVISFTENGRELSFQEHLKISTLVGSRPISDVSFTTCRFMDNGQTRMTLSLVVPAVRGDAKSPRFDETITLSIQGGVLFKGR